MSDDEQLPPKARIITVGALDTFHDDEGKLYGVRFLNGWSFEFEPHMPIMTVHEGGMIRYLGYSPYELAEIATRWKEFTTLPARQIDTGDERPF